MAAHLIQDQNLNIHFGGKNAAISKALKKGGGLGGGRKALNDISNSAKPSATHQQASKKNYSTNVISIGKDLDASRTKCGTGRKENFAKAPPEKVGRKALTDLTNSSKPGRLVSKKNAGATIPTSIVEEQFLHNHDKCIKAHRKVMDIDCFLKEVGLGNDMPVHCPESPRGLGFSMKSMPETPMKLFEVEEMPEFLIHDQVPRCETIGTCGDFSPFVRSPQSPKTFMSWKDDIAPYFTLIGTPNLPKHY